MAVGDSLSFTMNTKVSDLSIDLSFQQKFPTALSMRCIVNASAEVGQYFPAHDRDGYAPKLVAFPDRTCDGLESAGNIQGYTLTPVHTPESTPENYEGPLGKKQTNPHTVPKINCRPLIFV